MKAPLALDRQTRNRSHLHPHLPLPAGSNHALPSQTSTSSGWSVLRYKVRVYMVSSLYLPQHTSL